MSLIESNYLGFGSGVVDPATGIHYQNRGSYFSLDAGPPERPRAAEADAAHAAPRDAVPGAGASGRGSSSGSMGGDAQPQIHAQFVSAVVDGGLDIRTAIAAPRFYIEPADHFAPPTAVSPRAAPCRRHRRRAARARPRAGPDRPVRFEPGPRACDRARRRRSGRTGWLAGGRDGPAQRGAAGGLVAAGRMRYSAPTGGSSAHTPPPPASARQLAAQGGVGRSAGSLTHFAVRSLSCSRPPCPGLPSGERLALNRPATPYLNSTAERRSDDRRPEEPVTSNVGQNYPYTSETEAERAAVVARLVAEREGLAGDAGGRVDAARRARALVGLEVPDAGLPGPAARRRVFRGEARGLRRLRRDLREDLPALATTPTPAPGRRPEPFTLGHRDRSPARSDAAARARRNDRSTRPCSPRVDDGC